MQKIKLDKQTQKALEVIAEHATTDDLRELNRQLAEENKSFFKNILAVLEADEAEQIKKGANQ